MKRRSRYVLRVITALCISVGSLAYVSFAVADGWGNNDGWSGAEPDDKVHQMCYPNSVSSALWWAGMDAMAVLDDLTTVRSVYQSCTQWTDVEIVKANLGSSTLGRYQCQVWTNGECDKALVQINEDWYTARYSGVTLDAHLQHDVCHEIGHSVGLSHDDSDPDCMKNGDHEIQHYRVHHINHIDNGIN